jgi:thiamine biosynthesis protein ThiI
MCSGFKFLLPLGARKENPELSRPYSERVSNWVNVWRGWGLCGTQDRQTFGRRGIRPLRILLRLAPEIVIKSDRVRARFQGRLVTNLSKGFELAGVEAKIESGWSRLFVDVPDQAWPGARDVLSATFGLASFSPVEFTCESTLEAIIQTGLDHYKDKVEGKTFRITGRRTQINEFKSMELNQKLGAALVPYAAGVSLKNPDVEIFVEARREGTSFFTQKFVGSGGMPLGTGGKVLCLMSGGLDSIVAAYRMQKRGLDVDYLFCNLAGKAYERSVVNVARCLHARYGHGSKSRLHVVDFSNVVEEIKRHVKPSYSQVILKRMFYRTAEIVANQSQAEAIVTGEAIAQVSSQTLTNLCVINQSVTMPVFRPLIGSDKSEIVQTARQIGTYELCSYIQEYCQLVPDRPVTAASIPFALSQEKHMDLSLCEQAVESMHTWKLEKMTEGDLGSDYLFTDSVPADANLIDLRPESEFNEWHAPEAQHCEWSNMLRGYNKWPKEGVYVLCCPHGLQSAVIAEKMQAKGYEAYSLRGGLAALRKSTS